MSVLSERIKKEREKLGITREDLAKKIGVSYSAIAMYEQGNREPNRELAIKLCETFNCSMDYLMGLTSYINPIKDLEKKLYQIDLSIDEYNKFLFLFIDEDIDDDDIKRTLHQNDKINMAFQECLELVYDYDDSGVVTIDENIDKIKNIIMSLDVSKVVHNYNEIVPSHLEYENHNSKNQKVNSNQFHLCPVYRTNLSRTT